MIIILIISFLLINVAYLGALNKKKQNTHVLISRIPTKTSYLSKKTTNYLYFKYYIILCNIIILLFEYFMLLDVLHYVYVKECFFLWFYIKNINIHISFNYDVLLVCSVLMVSLISFCIQIYAFYYMSTKEVVTFSIYILSFSLFMNLFLLSGNLLILLVGWEGIGCALFY